MCLPSTILKVFFVDMLLSTTLDFQESLSLNSPLDFLTKKPWSSQGTMFIENHGEGGHFERSPKKRIEETFGVNFYLTLMKLEKQIPLWRCSSFRHFLVARNRDKKQSAQIFRTRWLLLNIVMFDIYVEFLGCIYIYRYMCFFPLETAPGKAR